MTLRIGCWRLKGVPIYSKLVLSWYRLGQLLPSLTEPPSVYLTGGFRQLSSKPETRIVGAIRDVEDGCHVDRCRCFHLLKQRLKVSTPGDQFVVNFSSYSAFRTTDFASQKWISVMGPGLSPSSRSCSDSLDNTSSTFKDHKDHQHLVHLEEDCADPDRNDHEQHNYHCLNADPDNSGQDFMEVLSAS